MVWKTPFLSNKHSYASIDLTFFISLMVLLFWDSNQCLWLALFNTNNSYFGMIEEQSIIYVIHIIILVGPNIIFNLNMKEDTWCLTKPQSSTAHISNLHFVNHSTPQRIPIRFYWFTWIPWIMFVTPDNRHPMLWHYEGKVVFSK